MVRSSAKVTGFTLVELLIATSILLLLVVSVSYSYSLFNEHWNRRLSKIEQQFSAYKSLDLVATAIRNTSVFYVSAELKQGRNNNSGFYFLGRDEGFTAVTNNSVAKAGQLAVFRLFRENDENGTLRLVYEEALLEQAPLVVANQPLDFSFRTVLATGIPVLSFSYYGDDSAIVPLDDISVVPKKWFVEYDGMALNNQPEVIRITIDQFDWFVELPTKAAQLKNRSVTDT